LGERTAGRDEGKRNERDVVDIAWHGTRLSSPGVDDPQGRALACTIAGFEGDAGLHVMMDMFREPLEFEVPVDRQRTWHLVVDNVAGASCGVQARSIVILAGTFS